MNPLPWYVSSEGAGLAQRIISLSALIIPVLSAFGVNIAPGDIEPFVNGGFVIVFAIWHLWAWARANFNKQNNLGKFAAK